MKIIKPGDLLKIKLGWYVYVFDEGWNAKTGISLGDNQDHYLCLWVGTPKNFGTVKRIPITVFSLKLQKNFNLFWQPDSEAFKIIESP